MPDWEFTVSKVLPDRTASVKSFIIEGMERPLAILHGLDEYFKWAGEELATDAANAKVPQQAIDYWSATRREGGKQLYEVLSDLEQWAISSTIKPAGTTVETTSRQAPTPRQATKNGKPPSQLPDLRTMLQGRLDLLQAQERRLLSERDSIVDELTEIREDLRQTTELLLTLGTPKKRGRKKADAGTEQS